MKSPELMAPVASFDMCKAAIHNEADAIYVGLPKFNARYRAKELSFAEIKEIIDYCHLYDAKAYIAFNVLIFQDEIKIAYEKIKEIAKLTPDAFIVQDIGLARLIKILAPDLEVHASTQMSITTDKAIKFTKDLNLSRYILARENSIDELKIIRKNTNKELEVFVHGAICISYSGQCLGSKGVWDRSANRGECAGPCRLPWEIFLDSKKYDIGDRKFILSPKDLCGIEDIKKLIEIGIDSLKIEGRLKTPQYVAITTSQYRAAIDSKKIERLDKYSMKLAYSREFHNGYLSGINHQKLIDGRFCDHRGAQIGEVVKILDNTIRIKTDAPIQKGDGLLFVNYQKNITTGGRIYHINKISKNILDLKFRHNFEWHKISKGMYVYHNDSPRRDKVINQSWMDRNLQKNIPIDIEISGKLDRPLTVIMKDFSGNKIKIESKKNLEKAKNKSLDEGFLKKNFEKLGHSPFKLKNFKCNLKDSLFFSQKDLRILKSEAISKLKLKRIERPKINLKSYNIDKWINEKNNSKEKKCKLNVLIRNIDQLDAITDLEIGTIYLDFREKKHYKEASKTIKNSNFKLGIATPRVLKPKENKILEDILKLNPDIVLIRNLGAIQYFLNYKNKLSLVGDFSLNISNSISSDYFLSKGLNRITPSYDLDEKNLSDLLKASKVDCFEIPIYLHLPEFHTEHCSLAWLLSDGTNKNNCGKPCNKHKIMLKDYLGNLHYLTSDVKCRNTIFKYKPKEMKFDNLKSLGVTHFRIEALDETNSELRDIINKYNNLINQ